MGGGGALNRVFVAGRIYNMANVTQDRYTHKRASLTTRIVPARLGGPTVKSARILNAQRQWRGRGRRGGDADVDADAGVGRGSTLDNGLAGATI